METIDIEVKQSKICTKCSTEQSLLDFHKAKKTKDKLHSWCKRCVYEYQQSDKSKNKRKEWKQKNKDRNNLKQRERRELKRGDKPRRVKLTKEERKLKRKEIWKNYHNLHKEDLNKKRMEHYWGNIDENRQKQRERAKRDIEKRREYKKQYREKNRDRINATRRKYGSKRKNDPTFYKNTPKGKVDSRISSLIRISLKGKKGGRSWETLVGYSLETLINHLENLFCNGMNWEELRKSKVVIDHVLPRELFEYNAPEDPQFKACWELSNLRPFWKEDNDKKSDYLPDGRRARHLNKEEKLEYLKSLGYNF